MSDEDAQSQLKRARTTNKKGKGRTEKTPEMRIDDWPREYLRLLGECMICGACNKPIGGKKKTIDVSNDDIKKHVNTELHIKKKKDDGSRRAGKEEDSPNSEEFLRQGQ